MTYIDIICDYCNETFKRGLNEFNRSEKQCWEKSFCSRTCQHKAQIKYKDIKCKQCNSVFQGRNNKQKFCSQSCAATYNNIHKITGTRVSKLELYLQRELPKLYKFKFKFNSKEEINSELDIYIPSLKLAFELNGIFHYEPIFGQEKLAQIQNNDDRKFQACLENKIELCIIDSSSLKYFKESNAKKYLDIIAKIINKKI